MKKLLSAMLALLLLLTLGACGGEGGSGTPSAGNRNQSDQSDSSGEPAQGKTITVHVTINPAFALTLDGEMNILSVEAENEDAEALLSGLELSGKTYEDGMGTILDTAYEQGYLKMDGQVSIQVDVWDYSAELMETLEAPVAQFEEEKAVSVSEKSQVQPEPITGDRPADLADIPDSKLNGLTALEVNGQKIYVERCVDKANKMTSFFYSYDSSLFGREAYKRVDLYFDGSIGITYNDENGRSISTYTGSDGYYSIHEYENRTAVRAHEVFPNGLTRYYTYYDNTHIATMHEVFPDGSFSDTTYTYHGNKCTGYTVYSNGDICEETRTENGNYLSRIWHWADGGYEEAHFTESGLTVKTECYYANGDYYIQIYYDNGNIKQYEFQTNGYSGQILYYENGNCMSEVTTNPDGSISRITYNPDGTVASREDVPAGG